MFDPNERGPFSMGRFARSSIALALFPLLVLLASPAAALDAPANAATRLREDLDRYPSLVARAAWVRAQTLELHAELARRGTPPTGAEIERMRRGTREHLELRAELMDLALRYETWLDDETAPPVPERSRTLSVMLGLGSAATLYENFEVALLPFQRDKRLRRIVNQSDTAFDLDRNQLLATFLEFSSPGHRRRVREAARWLGPRQAWIDAQRGRDPTVATLAAVLDESAALASIRRGNVVADHLAWTAVWLPRGGDDFFGARREGVHRLLATLFPEPDGGAPPVGQGRLPVTPELLEDLRANLRPLDLLLDKSRYRTVDRFIPGYFTHVGIWVGTPAELQDLGLWEHPLIRPHHQAILGGARIVEAVRSGVGIKSLADFLHLDDVAILRAPQMSDVERADGLLRAFAQVGKGYDFNFDVRTTDRLMCSELVYLVYADIPWRTDMVLWRRIMAPDHVAQMVLGEGAPLQIIVFYHEGERLVGDAVPRVERLVLRL